ncbi:MAG: ATP synthase F1 subunit gamma [Bacteroidales bacterium]|nr:ATP synthase F1 subunit gamma [Bacteroidales bacterium]
MPSLKDIRLRIQSVVSTRQITSAMKMVSAAKLRKTQDAIIKLRPYVNKMQEIVSEVTSTLHDEVDVPFIKPREHTKVLLVLVTSNRGLCGAFNSNLIRQMQQYVKEKYNYLYEQGNIHIYCIGKKGFDYLKNKPYKIFKSNTEIIENVTYSQATELANELMTLFEQETYSHIEFFYNKFKNAAVQIVTQEQFLPIPPPADTNKKKIEGYLKNYIFEPNEVEILTEILPASLRSQVYKILLDSVTAEHGARMTAMHKATDNATEMLYELRLNYNKARQAAITKEILEIVSGANALKG